MGGARPWWAVVSARVVGEAMLARAPCTTCQGREELRGGGGVEQLPQLHAARIEGRSEIEFSVSVPPPGSFEGLGPPSHKKTKHTLVTG